MKNKQYLECRGFVLEYHMRRIGNLRQEIYGIIEMPLSMGPRQLQQSPIVHIGDPAQPEFHKAKQIKKID